MATITNPDRRASSNDNIISLSDIISIIMDGKYLIVGSTLLFALCSLIYLWAATPVYRADALIQVESHKSPLGGLVDMENALTLSGDAASETEIEIIRSRFVLGYVVETEKLEIVATPDYLPFIGLPVARQFDPDAESGDILNSPLFGMNQYAWGGEQIIVERFNTPFLGEEYTIVAGKQGHYQLFLDDKLILEGKKGESAAAQNGKVRLFISELKGRPGTHFNLTLLPEVTAIEKLSKRLSVSEKIKKTGVLTLALTGADSLDNERILQAISDRYLKQNIERTSAEAENSLKFLDAQLPEVRAHVELAESKLNRYQQENQTVDLSLETKAILDQSVKIDSQLAQLELQTQHMAERYTKSHPVMIELQQQKKYLEGLKKEFVNQTEDLPKTQQEVLRLARDVEVSTAVYTELLNKAQELRIVEASAIGNVRILDHALSAIEPIKPKKILIVLLAIVVGGMLGTGSVFVNDMMKQGVKTPEEIESRTGMPVYASVSESKQMALLERNAKKQEAGYLLAQMAPADLSIEALRSLRTNLAFALMEAENNRIMITGPSPGVGKSFISANLAALIADSNQRVLLIDADLRKGHINRVVGKPRKGGLAEVIAGQITMTDAIHKVSDNFDIVTCGYYPPNPSELLMMPFFKALLERFSEKYDVVIIDTPPVLAVTDPVIVGKLCATNFIVVRAHVNPIREIQYAASRFEQNGVKIKGYVLNGIIQSKCRYGSYQYSYS